MSASLVSSSTSAETRTARSDWRVVAQFDCHPEKPLLRTRDLDVPIRAGPGSPEHASVAGSGVDDARKARFHIQTEPLPTGAPVACFPLCPLYFWFAQRHFVPVRSAVTNAEAHIPTQPSSPLKDARISFSYEDQERSRGAVPPAC